MFGRSRNEGEVVAECELLKNYGDIDNRLMQFMLTAR